MFANNALQEKYFEAVGVPKSGMGEGNVTATATTQGSTSNWLEKIFSTSTQDGPPAATGVPDNPINLFNGTDEILSRPGGSLYFPTTAEKVSYMNFFDHG
jgi:hypothetical protein